MAFLAPLAAAGTGATVGFAAPALAKMGAAATTAGAAGTALNAGIAAGSALAGGGGASMAAMPALSYAGMGLGKVLPTAASNTLSGIAAGFNPASYLASSGLGGALPTASSALSGIAAPTASKLAQTAGALKSLSPSQLEYLRASSAGFGQAGTPSTFLKTASSPLDEIISGTGPLGPGAPSPSSYLTGMQPTNIPSLEIRQAANLANASGPSAGLRMPTGVSEGLSLKTPIGAETPLSQGPLPFQQMLPSGIKPGSNFATNAMNLIQNPSMQGLKDYAEEHPYATSAAVGLGTKALFGGDKRRAPEQDKGMIRPYEFTRTQRPEAYAVSPLTDTSERLYFNDVFTPLTPIPADSEAAKKAEGGIAQAYAVGGPVEQMAAMNSVGANTGYPMAGINTPMYANPMMQRPEAVNVISPSGDAGVTAYSGEPRFATGGGISDLGGYSDGGRLLKGPGDGVSDSIPAVIGKRQPARLANNEFVIPARIVSEIGNGSTDAGAKKLYKMMERVQKRRAKTVGKDKVAVDSGAHKEVDRL